MVSKKQAELNRQVVPCPGCVRRAPWIKTGSSLQNIPMAETDTTHVVTHDHADPHKAMRRTVVTVDPRHGVTVTETYARNPIAINSARKGYQCNACADLEDGAWATP